MSEYRGAKQTLWTLALYIPIHALLDVAALSTFTINGSAIYLVFVVNAVLAAVIAAALARQATRFLERNRD